MNDEKIQDLPTETGKIQSFFFNSKQSEVPNMSK